MDNDSLLSTFLIIAIISVTMIDVFIIYMFVHSFCCKHEQQRRDLSKPLIVTSTTASVNDDYSTGYYTSL